MLTLIDAYDLAFIHKKPVKVRMIELYRCYRDEYSSYYIFGLSKILVYHVLGNLLQGGMSSQLDDK